MINRAIKLNDEVTKFLAALSHPLKKEIAQLREDILTANKGLSENIKWNSPNFHYEENDRITMRIQPPKQIQLVFHRGAKVLEQPRNRLINDNSGMLTWKTNDRAVATFKNMEDITSSASPLAKIINDWLEAAAK
jgi:hypothetical protein